MISFSINNIRQKSIEMQKQNIITNNINKKKCDFEYEINTKYNCSQLIECLKRKIILSSEKGERIVKIKIRADIPNTYDYDFMYYITEPIIGQYGNVKSYNFNGKILNTAIKYLQKNSFSVSYLSIFNRMKGIYIKW